MCVLKLVDRLSTLLADSLEDKRREVAKKMKG